MWSIYLKSKHGTRMCNRNLVCGNQKLICIHSTFVKFFLEYSLQLWAWQLKQDVETIGKVQKRAIKVILESENKTFKKSLEELTFPREERV